MVQRKSPIDAFFTLGDKVTGGNPVRKSQFDYYLMWIIFLGFLLILYSNLSAFYYTQELSNLGWAAVIGAILWFQYSSMRMARTAMKMMMKSKANNFDVIEDVQGMVKKTK